MMQIRISLFVLLLTTTSLAQAQNKLTIAFGTGNQIVYDLTRGEYALTLNRKQVVADAYAYCSGDETFDSRVSDKPRRYTKAAFSDATGKGTLYSIATGRLEQLFYIYPGKDYCLVELRVGGSATRCNYMAVLSEGHLTAGAGADLRALRVPFDNDMYVRYDAKELSHANFTSSEVTAVYDNTSRNGLVLGALQHDAWKSGVKLATPATGTNTGAGANTGAETTITLFAGLSDTTITHDRIPHGLVTATAGYCHSPKMLIGHWADWREGMEAYARLNMILGPRVVFNWTKPTPMVWNSWGAIQTKLTLEKVKGVVDFFHDSCQRFRRSDGSLFIDLDAFWDNMTPGGLDGDVSKLSAFVAYCKEKGMHPGVYWTPFAEWGKTDREITGSSVANPSGVAYRYEQVWTRQNGKPVDIDGGRAIDPTHPATRWMIRHTLGKLKELGFEMIKVDFLGHGAIEADHFYDPAVTTGMQAFRSGMTLVDSVLDGSMLLYSAICPNLATCRYVHMRRIACDAFIAIDNSEYTLNSTGYGWWLGRMYNYIDADHVVFDGAPEGMNRARLAASLVTGTLTTGDDYSVEGKWRKMGKLLLQNEDLLQIARNGVSFRPVEANTGDRGVNVFTQIVDGKRMVAVFNYSDKDQEYSVPLERLGVSEGSVRAKELFTSETTTYSKNIDVKVPASDVRIYRLEP